MKTFYQGTTAVCTVTASNLPTGVDFTNATSVKAIFYIVGKYSDTKTSVELANAIESTATSMTCIVNTYGLKGLLACVLEVNYKTDMDMDGHVTDGEVATEIVPATFTEDVKILSL